MTTAINTGAARPPSELAPSATQALYPQSTGPDGFERLNAAWQKPRRFGFFTEVNNNHIGLLYIATGFLFFLGAGVLALLMKFYGRRAHRK